MFLARPSESEGLDPDPLFSVRQNAQFRQTAAAALSPPLGSSAVFPSGPQESTLNLGYSRSAHSKEKSDRKQEKVEDCLLKEDVDISE